MGCDWNIVVQGLFTDDDGKRRWVSLFSAYSMTPCGGNPVRSVLRQFIETSQTKGSYGDNFPVDDYEIQNELKDEKEELETMQRLYDKMGEVITKKRKRQYDDDQEKEIPSGPEAFRKFCNERDLSEDEGFLEFLSEKKCSPEEVRQMVEVNEELSQEIAELSQKISPLVNRIKERGFIAGRPEWKHFLLSISEYQGFCDALLQSDRGWDYFNTYSSMLAWANTLENFTPAAPSTKRVSKDSSGYKKYYAKYGGEQKDDMHATYLNRWDDFHESYKVAKSMMPDICCKIGCNELHHGEMIARFCGMPAPIDLRFAVVCDEGHTEQFRNGNLEGGANLCCIM